MSEIADKISKWLRKKEVDWTCIEEYVSGLGDAINTYDKKEDESVLSEIYMSDWRVGYINERLTDLFLKHGFDVKANEGKNGSSCLHALCWSSYDKYVLHIAEKLLDIGANSMIEREDDTEEDDAHKGVLDSIVWKFGYWNIGEYDSANMFVAYYEMVYRQQNGKNYKGIRAFRDTVGEAVTKVYRLNSSIHKHENRTSYLLQCGDKQLLVNEYVEFFVDPYAKDEAVKIEDVSVDFTEILGAKVRGLRYFNSSLAKISFDNGYALLIGYNESAGIEEDGAWVRITTNKQAKLPALGTVIESITLWGDIRHAENSTFYSENTVVINTKENAYGLYSHSIRYGEGTVRVEGLSRDLVAGLNRKVEIHNPTLKHIEYSGEAIKWISVNSDEGILYIVTNHFTEIALFMSAFEIADEEILRIGSYTKGLSKIKFLD